MVQKIGIREFRNNLAMYLNTNEPVAVTRHGHTVGYFLPTQQDEAKIDSEKLKLAAERLEALLVEHGISEDELFSEFRQLRSQDRQRQ